MGEVHYLSYIKRIFSVFQTLIVFQITLVNTHETFFSVCHNVLILGLFIICNLSSFSTDTSILI